MTLTCRKQKRKRKKAKCSFNTPVTRTAEHLNPKPCNLQLESAFGKFATFFLKVCRLRENFFFLNKCLPTSSSPSGFKHSPSFVQYKPIHVWWTHRKTKDQNPTVTTILPQPTCSALSQGSGADLVPALNKNFFFCSLVGVGSAPLSANKHFKMSKTKILVLAYQGDSLKWWLGLINNY